jgi:hypothetical protein
MREAAGTRDPRFFRLFRNSLLRAGAHNYYRFGRPWEACMGKFITGLLIGLLTGLIFADTVFPDGFVHAVEQFSSRVQNRIPGR